MSQKLGSAEVDDGTLAYDGNGPGAWLTQTTSPEKNGVSIASVFGSCLASFPLDSQAECPKKAGAWRRRPRLT